MNKNKDLHVSTVPFYKYNSDLYHLRMGEYRKTINGKAAMCN